MNSFVVTLPNTDGYFAADMSSQIVNRSLSGARRNCFKRHWLRQNFATFDGEDDLSKMQKVRSELMKEQR